MDRCDRCKNIQTNGCSECLIDYYYCEEAIVKMGKK